MAFRRSTLGAGAIAVLAVLFVALTVLSSTLLRGLRLDLTENRLYTIAAGTQKIVAGLKEPLNFYLFLSSDAIANLPALRTYGTRVQEFLEELASRSGGKLRLTMVDPQPFSEAEDRAAEFGIRAVPIGAEGNSLYFGLAATNSTDGRGVIDFFDPGKEAFLEYDVAKLVQQLSSPRKPVVAWLSSLPMTGGFDPSSGQSTDPWLVLGQAEQSFDIRPFEPGATEIAADVDVLVLVHPKALAPATQYAIDQYALRGGRILLFVDPVAEADQSGAEPGNPLAQMGADRASDPGPLLAAWGVGVVRGSATRGGVGGLLRLVRTVREGTSVVILPDGPRGPRYVAKGGVVQLARLTGVPIVPITYAASRVWRLGSWDQLVLPLPFARFEVAVGAPIAVPADADAAELERRRAEVETSLRDLTRAVEARAGWPADALLAGRGTL